jgi:uncharacterized lipoprotein YmbA
MKKLLAVLLLMGLCGCSAVQMRQEFIGYSMNDVKNSKTKQVQEFDMSTADCIVKIKDILKDMGAIAREDEREQYIRADNFQGVFRSSIDTTQVGILVTSISEGKCRVEIASGNIDLAAFVAKEITIKISSKKDTVLTK